nr:MAG: hypothetical protein H1Rhizo27491_000002 [Mitovirus sp.]
MRFSILFPLTQEPRPFSFIKGKMANDLPLPITGRRGAGLRISPKPRVSRSHAFREYFPILTLTHNKVTC